MSVWLTDDSLFSSRFHFGVYWWSECLKTWTEDAFITLLSKDVSTTYCFLVIHAQYGFREWLNIVIVDKYAILSWVLRGTIRGLANLVHCIFNSLPIYLIKHQLWIRLHWWIVDTKLVGKFPETLNFSCLSLTAK